jgi:hypothetical protein
MTQPDAVFGKLTNHKSCHRSRWLAIYYSFIHSFIHSSIYSFIHSFIHPSIHSLIHPSIYSFIHPSIHSSIHSFIHSFIYSIIHSFIHLSIYSFNFWKRVTEREAMDVRIQLLDQIQLEKPRGRRLRLEGTAREGIQHLYL